MSKLHVKDGTPVGNQHLCKSCSHGQFTTGYRESEVLVICTNVYPTVRMTFVVHECSEYYDKLQPSYEQMKRLAIEVEPTRRSKKMQGFSLTRALRPAEIEEGDDEDEVARFD